MSCGILGADDACEGSRRLEPYRLLPLPLGGPSEEERVERAGVWGVEG